MPAVRRCPADLRDRVLETVVTAFAGDPLLRWVWPAEARYDACARRFFGLLLDLRLESGEVWVHGEGDAVSMWDPPGGLYVPPTEDRWAAVQRLFTDEERRRWQVFDASMSVPAAAAPYWYLGVLATSPDRQRQGLGRAVLAPMLAAADRTALPIYLETASSANVRFYAALGFRPQTEVVLPDGPRCWLLRRDP
ncbi:GNAT family N-acetyltransferase [Oryzihumus sp.]